MSPLPKEHGAYGQVTLPLIAAFAVAGATTSGVLTALAVVAGFLAHEPLLVVLGQRGVRARREHGTPAMRWLVAGLIVGIAASVGALWTIASPLRWSFLIPAVPAAALMFSIARGAEKSWWGETAAALAFTMAAFPIVLAGGLPLATAVTVVLPLTLLFVTTTLAVRVVILRVRGGGNPRATANTRRALVLLAAASAVSIGVLIANQLVSLPTAAAAVLGPISAVLIAAYPLPPTRLRAIGWTLVAISLVTTALVIAGVLGVPGVPGVPGSGHDS
ncbi:MAG: YwiC-like family protein [Acidobacteria bacterium]|nr:YwiC-like family protein [Acidobacteriota bacterium]